MLGVESVPDGLAGRSARRRQSDLRPLRLHGRHVQRGACSRVLRSWRFRRPERWPSSWRTSASCTTSEDPGRALFTLVDRHRRRHAGGRSAQDSASILRFVSNAVMVGFINAVGVNIILGQLDNFTGYEADGAEPGGACLRPILLNFGQVHWPTLAIGCRRSSSFSSSSAPKLGPLGMVVAIVVASGTGPDPRVGRGHTQRHRRHPIGSLPAPMLPRSQPDSRCCSSRRYRWPSSGWCREPGSSANFPNPDGTYPNASRDFIGPGRRRTWRRASSRGCRSADRCRQVRWSRRPAPRRGMALLIARRRHGDRHPRVRRRWSATSRCRRSPAC